MSSPRAATPPPVVYPEVPIALDERLRRHESSAGMIATSDIGAEARDSPVVVAVGCDAAGHGDLRDVSETDCATSITRALLRVHDGGRRRGAGGRELLAHVEVTAFARSSLPGIVKS